MTHRSLDALYTAYAKVCVEKDSSSASTRRKPTAIQLYTGKGGQNSYGGFRRMETCRQALDAIDRYCWFLSLVLA